MEREREYILYLVLDQFLGLNIKNFNIYFLQGCVVLENEQKELKINAEFFGQDPGFYLTNKSLPVQPLSKVNLSEYSLFNPLLVHEVPVIYGDTNLRIQDNCIELGLDIFGSCFFMLTRYEELVKPDVDKHGRFPSKASLAYQEGFLERPVVDEYVEVLWCCMQYLWPNLSRKENNFKQLVSCDVDWVFDNRTKWPQVAKTLLGDLLKRRSFGSFRDTLSHFIQGTNRFMTFDFIMDICEKYKAELAFYFIPKERKQEIDGDYSIKEDVIKDLLREIAARGHEIGFHPSYNSYLQDSEFSSERDLLMEVLSECGLSQTQVIGGRQHYLRWKTPETIRNWEAMNFKYESTLGYADHIGFRCGTAREYPFYDLRQGAQLGIVIRPLVVMEVSMIEYMGLTHAEMRTRVKRIKDYCRFYGTNFTLLWHNNFLIQRAERETYEYLVSC